MDIITVLTQVDWIRALRFWLLVGSGLAAWEAASTFGHALAKTFTSK